MLHLILRLALAPWRSHQALILENVALRHQLQVLNRGKKRPRIKDRDRLLWILLQRVWADWRRPLAIVRPETVVGWHRKGFRAYWRRKSRTKKRGRPRLRREERKLIYHMACDNPTWEAPRIHDELAMLGIEVSPTTVAKYMRISRRPFQTWRTFLKNHAHEIVSMDFFTVPTLTCQVLYVLLLIENGSRRIVHFNVTAHPTAEWTGFQLLQAFPWDTAPRYLMRDRDRIYGDAFLGQVRALGIEQIVTSYKSPWQNPHVERLIGTVRRECLDHMIVLGEDHLLRILRGYVEYYNESRTHLGLGGDCPMPRRVESPSDGSTRKRPMVGGLHHRYYREAA